MADIPQLRSKFLHAYANLPEPERTQVVVTIDDKAYSWDAAHSEINNNTSLGNEILKKLQLLEIL